MLPLPLTLFSSKGLGTGHSSLQQIGDILPSKSVGQAGVEVSVNLANGNLVVKDPLCPVVEVARLLPLQMIYNSQAEREPWRFSARKSLRRSNNSNVVILTESDGTEVPYTLDSGVYIAPHQGDGKATLQYVAGSDEPWSWRDPKTGDTEFYNEAGQRVRHCTKEGRSTRFEYAHSDIIITGPSNLVYALRHELEGQVSLYALLSNGESELLRRYHFNEAGLLERTVFLSEGYEVKYTYGNEGLTDIQQSDGSTLRFSYDNTTSHRRVETVSTPKERHGIYRFNYSNPLRPQVGNDETKCHIHLDESAQVEKVRKEHRGADNQILFDDTDYQYTADSANTDYGHLTHIAHPGGGKENFEYDELTGLPSKHVRANGQTQEFIYEKALTSRGLLLAEIETVDEKRQVTHYVWDKAFEGQHRFLRFKLSPSVPQETPANTAANLASTRAVTEYLPYERTGERRLTRQYLTHGYQYDSPEERPPPLFEMEQWVAAQQAANAPVGVTEHRYDFRSQPTYQIDYGQTNPSDGSGIVDDSVQVAGFTHARSGLLTHQRQLLSYTPPVQVEDNWPEVVPSTQQLTYAEHRTEFDDLQRPTEQCDALETKTQWSYQDSQRRYTKTKPNGHRQITHLDTAGLEDATEQSALSHGELQYRHTRFVRDVQGRVSFTTHPDGAKTYTFYDALHRPVVELGRAGLATRITYDMASRSVSRTRYSKPLDISMYEEVADRGELPLSMVLHLIEIQNLPTQPNNRQGYTFLDTSGRTRYVIDAGGYIEETVYDEADRAVKAIEYAEPLTEAERLVLLSGEDLGRAVNPETDWVNQTFYTATGQVLLTQDEAGYVTHYRYNLADQLIQKTRYATPTPITDDITQVLPEPNNKDSHHHYYRDAAGRLTLEVNAEGYVRTHHYYPHGKVKHTREYANKLPDAQRHTAGQALNRAPELPEPSEQDKTTDYQYDKKLRLTQSSDSRGKVTMYAYDEMDHEIKRTEQDARHPNNSHPDYERSVQRRYDGWGQLTHYANPFISGLIEAIASTPHLNEAERLMQIDEAWERAQRHFYESSGLKTRTEQWAQLDLGQAERRLKQVFFYDLQRRLSLTVSPEGAAVEQEYQVWRDMPKLIRQYVRAIAKSDHESLTGGFRTGDVAETIDTLLSEIAKPCDDVCEQLLYDVRDLLIKRTDPLEQDWEFKHNARGEVILELSPGVNGNTHIEVKTEYEQRGLPIQTTRTAGTLCVSTASLYDHLKKVSQHTDEMGEITDRTHDRLGRISWQRLPGQTTGSHYEHDAWDALTEEVDAVGACTRYEHDQITRKSTTLFPVVGTKLVLRMNIFDEKIEQSDALNQVQRFTHAPNGATDSHTDGLGRTRSEVFNNVGWSLETSDPLGMKTRRHVNRDAFEVANIRDFGAKGHQNSTVSHALDALGRKEISTDPSGVRKHRKFDRKSRVIQSILDPKTPENPTGLHLVTATTHNAQDSRIIVTQGDNTTANQYRVHFGQDDLNRDIDRTVDPVSPGHPNGLEISHHHTLDKKGRIEEEIDANGHITRHLYDARDNELFVISADGRVTACLYSDVDTLCSKREYANRIEPSALTQPITPALIQTLLEPSTEDSVTHYVYDGNRRECFQLHAITAPTAQGQAEAAYYVTETDYDTAGRKCSQIGYSAPVTLSPEATGMMSLEAVKQQLTHQGLDASLDNRHQYWLRDSAHQERFYIDAAGYVHEQRYDTRGRIITSIHYGEQLASESAALALAKALASRLSENASEEELSTLLAEYVPVATVDRHTQTWFNTLDKPEYLVKPNGAVQHFIYDEHGNLLEHWYFSETVDPTQDRASLHAAIERLHEQDEDIRIKSNTWDAANRKLTMTDAQGCSESFSYDALSLQKTHTDRAGNIHTFEHDRAKRLIEEESPAVAVHTTSMTPSQTLLLSEGAERTIKKRYERDDNGNVLRILHDADGDAQRVMNIIYDSCNRPKMVRVEGIEIDDPSKPADFADEPVAAVDLNLERIHNAKGLLVYEKTPGHTHLQPETETFTVYDSLKRKAYTLVLHDAALGQYHLLGYRYNAFGETTERLNYHHPITMTADERADFMQTGVLMDWLQERIGSDPEHDRYTRYQHDKKGHAIEERSNPIPTYNPETGVYQLAEPIQENHFDAFGQCVETRRPLFGGNTDEQCEARTRHWFDHSGHEVASAHSYRADVNAKIGYRVKRKCYDPHENLTQTREYAKPIDGYPELSWTLSDLDAAVEESSDDRIQERAYDKRNLLTKKIKKAVIRQAVEHQGDRNRMWDLPPQDLEEAFCYNVLEHRVKHIRADGKAEFRYVDAQGNHIADIGVHRTVTEDGQAKLVASVTRYYNNAHGERVGSREYKSGTQETDISPGELPDDITASGDDILLLFLFDNRGALRCHNDGEGRLYGMTYTASQKVAREWNLAEGWMKSGLIPTLAQRTDEKRYTYDAVGHTEQVAHYRDQLLCRLQRLQHNIFGDTTAETSRETPDAWPLYRDFMGDHFQWRGNDEQGKSTITLRNLRGDETARLQSATIDLSEISLADIPALLLNSEVDLREFVRCPSGQILQEKIPPHLSHALPDIATIPLQMQVGTADADDFGAVNISWPTTRVVATPEFFIWTRGDSPDAAEKLPIQVKGQRSGVDVSHLPTDHYHYEVRYTRQQPVTGEEVQSHQTTGEIAIITEHSATSTSVVPEMITPSTLALHGQVDGLNSIDLYRANGNFVRNFPVHNGQVDLSAIDSGQYTLLAQYQEGSTPKEEKSLPFKVHTAQLAQQVLSRQLSPESTLDTLDRYGELRIWDELPIDYHTYSMQVNVEYRNEEDELSFYEGLVAHDTHLGDFVDEDGATLSANIDFGTKVSKIESLTLSVIRGPEDAVLLHQVQVPDANRLLPTTHDLALEVSPAVSTHPRAPRKERAESASLEDTWLDVASPVIPTRLPGTIDYHDFAKQTVLILEPTSEAERDAAHIQYFDTTASSHAQWVELEIASQTAHGVVLNANGFSPGCYPFVFEGQEPILSAPRFSVIEQGSVYGSETDDERPPQSIVASRYWTRDVWGNPLSYTNAAGHTTDYRYNDANAVVETIFPEAQAHDEDGQPYWVRSKLLQGWNVMNEEIGQTDEKGYTKIKQLDASQNVTHAWLGDGTLLSHNMYDNFERVIGFEDAAGHCWRHVHDKEHNIVSSLTPLNRLTRHGYTAYNHLIESELPGVPRRRYRYLRDFEGTILAEYDPNARETLYDYDLAGHHTCQTYDDGLSRRFWPDYFGYVSREQLLDGSRLHYLRDYEQQVTRQFSLNQLPHKAYELVHSQIQYWCDLQVPAVTLRPRMIDNQHITHEYSGGYLVKSVDSVHNKTTYRGHDEEGRQVYLRIEGNNGALAREIQTEFDPRSRERFTRDSQMVLYTGYDEASNRVYLLGEYHQEDNTILVRESWNTFDAAHRALIDSGVRVDAQGLRAVCGASDTRVVIVDGQGMALTYLHGLRETELRIVDGAAHRQTLTHDAERRVSRVSLGSNYTDFLYYPSGHLATQEERNSQYRLRRELSYFLQGWQRQEVSYRDGNRVQTVDYKDYSARGSSRLQETDFHRDQLRTELRPQYRLRRHEQQSEVTGRTHNEHGWRGVKPALRYFDSTDGVNAQISVQSNDGKSAQELRLLPVVKSVGLPVVFYTRHQLVLNNRQSLRLAQRRGDYFVRESLRAGSAHQEVRVLIECLETVGQSSAVYEMVFINNNGQCERQRLTPGSQVYETARRLGYAESQLSPEAKASIPYRVQGDYDSLSALKRALSAWEAYGFEASDERQSVYFELAEGTPIDKLRLKTDNPDNKQFTDFVWEKGFVGPDGRYRGFYYQKSAHDNQQLLLDTQWERVSEPSGKPMRVYDVRRSEQDSGIYFAMSQDCGVAGGYETGLTHQGGPDLGSGHRPDWAIGNDGQIIYQDPTASGMHFKLSGGVNPFVRHSKPQSCSDFRSQHPKASKSDWERSVRFMVDSIPSAPLQYKPSSMMSAEEIARQLGQKEPQSVATQISHLNHKSPEYLYQANETVLLPQSLLWSGHQEQTLHGQFVSHVLGSLIPKLQWAEPPKGSCLKQITRMVIGIVTAVVAFIYGPPGSGVGIGKRMAVRGATNAGLQGLAVGVGLLDEVSFSDVIMQSFYGGMTGYVEGNAGLAELRHHKQGIAAGLNYAFVYGTTNALTQMTQMALGVRDKFDVGELFRGMASAGTVSGVRVGSEVLDNNLLKSLLYGGSLLASQGMQGIPPTLESLGINLLGVTIDYSARVNGWYQDAVPVNDGGPVAGLMEEAQASQTFMVPPEDKGYQQGLLAAQGNTLSHIPEPRLEPEALKQGYAQYRANQDILSSEVYQPELTRFNGMDYRGATQQRDFLSEGQLQLLREGELVRGRRQVVHGMQGLPDVREQVARVAAREMSQQPMACLASDYVDYHDLTGGAQFTATGPSGPSGRLAKAFEPFQTLQSDMLSANGVGYALTPESEYYRVKFVSGVEQGLDDIIAMAANPLSTAIAIGTGSAQLAWDVGNGYMDMQYGLSTEGSRVRRAAQAQAMRDGLSSFWQSSRTEKIGAVLYGGGYVLGGGGGAGFFGKVGRSAAGVGSRPSPSLGPMLAEEANATFVSRGMRGPYDSSLRPRTIQLQQDKLFVRVHGESNQARSWMMRPKEVSGLTPAQIQAKFALPELPKYMSEVHLPGGAYVRVGRAASQPGWGVGGGMQYQALGWLSKHMFHNQRPLVFKPEYVQPQQYVRSPVL